MWCWESSVAACRTADTGPQRLQSLRRWAQTTAYNEETGVAMWVWGEHQGA